MTQASLDPKVLSNYRLVSNLAFLTKLVERFVIVRICEHFALRYLLPPVQLAYIPYHSTETALPRVFDDLLLTIDNGDDSLLVPLHMSAAFPSVDHDILIRRLEIYFGVSGTALDWVRELDSPISSPRTITYDVPQGLVSGPALFTLCTNPIHVIMSAHGVRDQEYGDDTQSYLVSN